MSDLQKRLQMSRLPPKAPMPPRTVGGKASTSTSGKKGFGRGKRDYTPVTWDQYFDHKQDIKIQENKFRVYESGEDGPVCFFIHGGGFSALSWAVLSKSLVECVHCRCAALDMRGHGDTYTTDDSDLSSQTLTSDVTQVIQSLYAESNDPVVLVGHSMGGAIAVQVAASETIPSLIGLAVIDVVEGTALDALTTMQSFLRGRPSLFKSLDHGIEWSVRTGHIRNLESARVSMVGQLKKQKTNETGTSAVDHSVAPPVTNADTICEEEEESSESHTSAQNSQDKNFKQPSELNESNLEPYTWRIDLTKTESYWRGWFEGLSNRFLSCSVPKLLLLAGVDRLDRELTVGQMQGKFQMQVLPQCGHAVHEDSPEKVADVLALFLVRHKFANSKDSFSKTFPSC